MAAYRYQVGGSLTWVASQQQDESQLLRGQALIDAQQWSDDRHG